MKLIILTSSKNGLPCLAVRALQSHGLSIERIVFSKGEIINPRTQMLRKLRKTYAIGVLGAINGVRIRKWFQEVPTPDIFTVANECQIPLFETPTVNCQRTHELFVEAEADLGLSLGNSYIAERIFSVPRLGMINSHGERLPEYRNAQSIIWPIYFSEIITGVTLHLIDKSIDTGRILLKSEIPIQFRESLEATVRTTLPAITTRAVEALLQVCSNFSHYHKEAQSQGCGRAFTTPTFSQFIRMERNNRLLFRNSLSQRNLV